MHRPTTSISKSSHLRLVAAGSLPASSATILSASVSATEVFGNSDVIVARLPAGSNAEDFAVACLDRVALFFHSNRVILHGLDVLEALSARLLLGPRARRGQ